MIIACLKGTNQMIGTSGLELPHYSKGKSTSRIMLVAVKTEYRRFGIANELNDETIRIAGQMGVEKVIVTTSFYNDYVYYLTNLLNKKNYTLTATKVQHKSSYIKNWFLATQDYHAYNCLEKII